MEETLSAKTALTSIEAIPKDFWKWIRCGIPFIKAVLESYEQYKTNHDQAAFAAAVIKAVTDLLSCLKA
ncbi:MAG TPA: hypothetical protein PKL08_01745 [Thermoanaerobaculaceae bacterium]|nr:hypothetical protein [Thermoanaerobaculaceae bacterium]